MPIVKWVGGKTALLPQFAELFPRRFNTYYEPFVGGGAVLLDILGRSPRQKCIAGDANRELINMYQQAQTNQQYLSMLAEGFLGQHNQQIYWTMRDYFNSLDRTLESAAAFLYLNRTCFNGLYRTNAKGHFNVPMGDYKNPRLPEGALDRFAVIARDVVFIGGDYQDTCATASAGDFVYFDPPYHKTFTQYQAEGFDEACQLRLRDYALELWRSGVQVALSNSDTSFIRAAYTGFKLHEVIAPRRIRNGADVGELLITNY
jgi:DNA adenine methylase